MLSLKYCLPPHADNTLTDNNILDFLNLQSLDIEDGINKCGVFLQHLHIPATVQVSIHCITREHHNTFGDAWMPVTLFVHAHLNAESPPIQALLLKVPDFKCSSPRSPTFEMVAWHSLAAFPSTSCPAGFVLALIVEAPLYAETDTIDLLMQVLGTLPLANVQTAQYELSLGATWNLPNVAAMLHCTPALESLWVTGTGSVTIAQALQPQWTADAGAQPTVTLLLPALKTLTFWQVDLGANIRNPLNFLIFDF
ncbi:hypothetical protein EWM64_g9591 [Hericium alpestre]|uniref:Uncharacterized protein n=1 Tax=Hericium alpestre TaxID=135208 RepID=A0A4Y9ZKQ1_9AGAM|nr:hypothetical protein EWM64_g9591 [Hericium alpestre]